MSNILFLDAQTKDETERITSFGDTYSDLIKDFLEWTKEHSITSDTLWYADIFEHISKKKDAHLVSLALRKDGGCTVAKPTRIVKNPYKRRKGWFNRER